jgi:hypothetical protein
MGTLADAHPASRHVPARPAARVLDLVVVPAAPVAGSAPATAVPEAAVAQGSAVDSTARVMARMRPPLAQPRETPRQ